MRSRDEYLENGGCPVCGAKQLRYGVHRSIGGSEHLELFILCEHCQFAWYEITEPRVMGCESHDHKPLWDADGEPIKGEK